MKAVLVICLALVIASPAYADGKGGMVASIEATIDYKTSTKEDDLAVDQGYLGAWYGNEDGYFYIRGEAFQDSVMTEEGMISYDSQRIVVDELYGKLYLYNLEWHIGKVIVPFGFEYLSRPNTSVFITAPDEDLFGFGLHCEAEYGILDLRGVYFGKGHYALKGSMSLWEDRNITSFSVTDVSNVKDKYGRFAITNMFRFGSTFFDAANLISYKPDVGDFWTRVVLAPGVFDSIGLFGGYYHVKEMYNGLHYFHENNTDSWTYGGFIDLSPNMTASLEWIDDNVFNPVTIQLTITF